MAVRKGFNSGLPMEFLVIFGLASMGALLVSEGLTGGADSAESGASEDDSYVGSSATASVDDGPLSVPGAAAESDLPQQSAYGRDLLESDAALDLYEAEAEAEAEAGQAVTFPSQGQWESEAPEASTELVEDYDAAQEKLLVSVAHDYDGAGEVAVQEDSDTAGTALVTLDGAVVAAVPGAWPGLSADDIELVEFDNVV